MAPMNWGYIAGFFDGEGCLHAINAGGSRTGRFRVTISQTQKEVLDEIAEFLCERFIDAYVLTHRAAARSPHKKQGWNLWITKQKSVAKFIEGVFPYLRVKKQRAEDYRRVCLLTPSLVGTHPVKVGLDGHVNGFAKLSREEFFSLMDSGMEIADIARLKNIDYSTVWAKAKRFGYPVLDTAERNRRRALVPFGQILDDYIELGSYQAVAKKHGLPCTNLRRRLIRNGVTPNEPFRKCPSKDISSLIPSV